MSDTQVPNRGVVLGVDIAGTKTALLVWDCATETILTRDAFPTPAQVGPEGLVDRLAEAGERLLVGSVRTRGELRAVGVSVPGRVEASAGRVLTAGNLAGWVDVPLKQLLETRLGVPAAIEHDASAAALGERWQGAGRDLASFAFIALGTGVGVGLISSTASCTEERIRQRVSWVIWWSGGSSWGRSAVGKATWPS